MSMFTVTYDISGIDRWLNDLDAGTGAVVMEAAQEIATAARSNVKVVTGSLHDTIGAEPDPAPDIPATHAWVAFAGDTSGGYKGGGAQDKAAGAPVDYAGAQEYGPGEHTPYMTPASEVGWIWFQQAMITMIQAISGGA